jgi:cytochrome c2
MASWSGQGTAWIRFSARRWRQPFTIAAVWILVTIISVCPMRAVANGSAAAAQPANAVTNARDVAQGKIVFDLRCNICHYSESTAQKIGPGLKGLYMRKRFANGKKVDDIAVARWIESGGKNMPGFKESLKPTDVQALIGYLKTL